MMTTDFKLRIFFGRTSMSRNVSSKSPPIYVFKRGWIDPTTVRVGDRVSKYNPGDPMDYDTVSAISPICPACSDVLGLGPDSCEQCLTSRIMLS